MARPGPHKIIAGGSAVIGVLLMVLAFIGMFFTVSLLTVVTCSYVAIAGGLLMANAVFAPLIVARYFGFMQYPAGSGSAFLFSGLLLLDVGGVITFWTAMAAIVWGPICIAGHFYLRKNGLGAVNVPLKGGDVVAVKGAQPTPPPAAFPPPGANSA